MASGDFGTVQPLGHPGCFRFCRDLCFEVRAELGIYVRLTHETWRAKTAQHGLYVSPDHVRDVLLHPWRIDLDLEDDKTWFYYSEPSGDNDRLFFVAVKCLPGRFKGVWPQRLRTAWGRVRGTGSGEAWVSSAYWITHPKSKGARVWP